MAGWAEWLRARAAARSTRVRGAATDDMSAIETGGPDERQAGSVVQECPWSRRLSWRASWTIGSTDAVDTAGVLEPGCAAGRSICRDRCSERDRRCPCTE